ncbi:MAG: lysylphosphatidylglycerol synthetase family protein [Mucilaginibacter polytrichastri]|nr:lysylphosphatidylglycerol synthetase family protein [Mucilaginibacter polytrichastri]
MVHLQSIRNKNFYFKEVLGFLFLLLAIYFVRHEQRELRSIGPLLKQTRIDWIIAGLVFTLIYLLLQAGMYVYSFRTVNERVGWYACIVLFLKRNLVSVFLPGGGITSLGFFSKEIEKKGVQKSNIYLASTLYGVVGILSVIIVGIPVIAWMAAFRDNSADVPLALGASVLFLLAIFLIVYSFSRKGVVYRLLTKYYPPAESIWRDVQEGRYSKKNFYITVLLSVFIEFTGMAHMLIAMAALGLNISVEAAVTGYIIATLFLLISPFLRGMGAIELSMGVLLTRLGYSTTEAVSITLLYRVFEFWLPLLVGAFSFVTNRGNLLLRVMPAFLLFGLGLINIVSVLTPALRDRLMLLREFLPLAAINASNYLVLLMGILLIITSAFLLRGFRAAWYAAITLCVFSLVGHLVKAFDYEEAIMALIVFASLAATRDQYHIRSDRRWQSFGIGTALWIFVAVTIYGIVGFYFLDRRHFNIDFTLTQSVIATFDNFTLLNYEDLTPLTPFGHLFLYSINLCGVLAIALIVYASIRPYVITQEPDTEEAEQARQILGEYGSSSVDYFKTYADKLFFFSDYHSAFVAYRPSGGFAIVLEEPVCAPDTAVKKDVLEEFEAFCDENGLKPAYYRVDEMSLKFYDYLGKKSILIGQEGIVDLEAFTLQGKSRASMRNTINSMAKKGFVTRIYEAPVKDGLLQKLQLVSDDWLKSTGRQEMVFSQGMFIWNELKNQTIITLENTDEKVLAFLNIIPDYAKSEATYDLIRKTSDAPGGNMDMLLIELINYCKNRNFRYLNLGLAPLSGIEQGRDLPEKTIKFAYEKFQQFRHYKGLRDFKEKFDPTWRNKYLIYENHYDLFQLPLALNRVMKP